MELKPAETTGSYPYTVKSRKKAPPRLVALKAMATRHGLNGLKIRSSTAKQGRKVFRSLMNKDQLNMYNYSVGHPTRVDLFRQGYFLFYLIITSTNPFIITRFDP